jgi:alkylhydroperoxidase family enzyme
MARITFPDRGMGEHVDWSLLRTDMAIGMGTFSKAVYDNTTLSVREREAARWTIALINDCVVCQDTRARDGEAQGVDEGFYAEVAGWATSGALSERERLAAEFAQRFALDHLAMDDDLWSRLHAAFDDGELAELTISCGMFLGLGRTLAVVGVRGPDERILV